MEEQGIDHRWRSWSSVPTRIKGGDVARSSSHEFILVMVICDQDHGHSQALKQACFTYDSRTDEWIQWSDYPPSFESHYLGDDYPRVCVIRETGKIYVASHCHYLGVYQMDTKEWLAKYGMNHKVMFCLSPLVNVNGTLHCIGVEEEGMHAFWIEERKDCMGDWQCIHDLGTTMGIFKYEDGELLDDVTDFSMIFVESKQLILLIGVQDGGTFRQVGSLGSIWSFSAQNIIENTWKRIEGIAFDFNRVSLVLTADEHFVIISGGQSMSAGNDGPPSDAIHVLDMRDDQQFVLKKCSIRCPVVGQCITFRTGNDLTFENQWLVVGWIRKVFQSKGMKHMQMPPDGVIRLIVAWFHCELLHWVYCSCLDPFFNTDPSERPAGPECSDHFVIPVKDIISSLCPDNEF